jgi:hypothetical protein
MCFSSRQAYSGPRSIWNHVQAQRNASEVPERAVFLRGDRFRGDGDSNGVGDKAATTGGLARHFAEEQLFVVTGAG